MKVLFDACVPRPLRGHLPGHTIRTAQEMGWGQLKNGALLREAEKQFEAFLTSDQNLVHQQNLAGKTMAVLILPTNDWTTIRRHAAEIAAELAKLNAGAFVRLSWA
jgi:predicted nuclease of predicted toxin-antitoxin system